MSFLITAIMVMGVVAVAYNKLQTDDPNSASKVDQLIAQVIPQSAPGLSHSKDAQSKVASLMPGKQNLKSSDFANKKQGAEYLKWKEMVKDPIGTIVSGTDISKETLNALASGGDIASLAGSISKEDLAKMGQNARNLKTAIDGHKVPQNLPGDAKAYMQSADASALELATAAERASEVGIKIKEGNLGLVTKLPGLVGDIKSAASGLNKAVNKAESALGAQ